MAELTDSDAEPACCLSDSRSLLLTSLVLVWVVNSHMGQILKTLDPLMFSSSMFKCSIAQQGEGPAVDRKRKRAGGPVLEAGDSLEVKLTKPCLCKSQSPKGDRVSCLDAFRSDPLLGKLKSWRSDFRDLHKLDQDRFVSQLCFQERVHFSPKGF